MSLCFPSYPRILTWTDTPTFRVLDPVYSGDVARYVRVLDPVNTVCWTRNRPLVSCVTLAFTGFNPRKHSLGTASWAAFTPVHRQPCDQHKHYFCEVCHKTRKDTQNAPH